MTEAAPEAPAPEAAPEPETPTTPDEPFDEARAKDKISKANREAENLRKRLKELEPLAAKAKELEDANKTETQKLIEERDSHKTTAEKTQADLVRLQVALSKAPDGMPAAKVAQLAKRLHGNTQEELEADADELFADFTVEEKTTTTTPGGGKPRERLRGGGNPETTPEETDPHKLAAQIPRGGF